MKNRLLHQLLVISTLFPIGLSATAEGKPAYWNQFRGPNGDGVSAATELPVEFDESTNVCWNTPMPDFGWSSPVIWGNEIWLTTGNDEKKELRTICVELQTGKITKDIKVFDMIEHKLNRTYRFDSPHLNSPATPTPVMEENRVFVSLGSQGVACLDRNMGHKLWRRRDLQFYQPVCQGSSPIVDDNNPYVAFDGKFEQSFAALDTTTGETRWKSDRNVGTDWTATLVASGIASDKVDDKHDDNQNSFATATLVEVNGWPQLIAPTAEAVMSYHSDSGEEL